jgi:nucleotide-binding universal stress UspA family protein
MANSPKITSLAKEDFRQARRQVALRQVYNRMVGKETNALLPFHDVRRALRVKKQIDRGLQTIPLDAIVGSVGRYTDFTRSFLPLKDNMEERWAKVYAVVSHSADWPPIQVYQIGEVYFILDGNHRVSVARRLKRETIQAYVTEVITERPLPADAKPDDLICQARYAEFLDRAELDKLRPGIDLSVTAPGAYRILDEHIDIHHYYMGLEQSHDIPFTEAATSWYDNIYMPTIQIIREKGLLRDFPDRTETDLYIWLARYQAELEESLGWNISTQVAADELAHTHIEKQSLVRVGKRLIDVSAPDELPIEPDLGKRLYQPVARRYRDKLFDYVLVPVGGAMQIWAGLEQAIVIAQRENSQLRGIHIVSNEAALDRSNTQAVQAEFDRRCEDAGVNGRLILKTGPIAQTIIDRARWNDLVVMNLAHPPGSTIVARLSSGFRLVIKRSTRPILAVPPGEVSPFDKILVAYDGGSKSKKALVMAASLVQRWQARLVVVTAYEKHLPDPKIVDDAHRYLEQRKIEADFIIESEKVVDVIMETAVSHNCNLIVMGGYGAQSVVEVMIGSPTNAILRLTPVPVLICP